MSTALLIELWHDVKPFIPAKDREDVAHMLVSKFDEYNLVDGIEDVKIGLDHILREAIVSFYFLDEEDNEQDDDNDDEYDN